MNNIAKQAEQNKKLIETFFHIRTNLTVYFNFFYVNYAFEIISKLDLRIRPRTYVMYRHSNILNIYIRLYSFVKFKLIIKIYV